MGLFYDEACKAGFAEEMETILRRGIRRLGLTQGQEIREALLDEAGELDLNKFQDQLLPTTSLHTLRRRTSAWTGGPPRSHTTSAPC